MRTFGIEDVEDIRSAPRSLTLVEYMALADVEYHMREKKITTRGHQLKMFELIKKAVAAYRGHRSCPWYEITFNRRDGKIWDPTKIPNRAAAFEDMVRREQDAGRVMYLVPQQEPEKPAVDADDATVANPQQVSPLALALQATTGRRIEDVPTPEGRELLEAQQHLAKVQGVTKGKPGRKPKSEASPVSPRAVAKAEGRRTMSNEARANIQRAAAERWARRRQEQQEAQGA